ncbi:hypothetical protein GRC12_01395 [Streptomyces griseorubiginosus]|nr:hypothetical protein [Streptomyces griseorubiginosus]
MTDWIWEYEGYDPADERLHESLCSPGNGCFATRARCRSAPRTRSGRSSGPKRQRTFGAGGSPSKRRVPSEFRSA